LARASRVSITPSIVPSASTTFTLGTRILRFVRGSRVLFFGLGFFRARTGLLLHLFYSKLFSRIVGFPPTSGIFIVIEVFRHSGPHVESFGFDPGTPAVGTLSTAHEKNDPATSLTRGTGSGLFFFIATHVLRVLGSEAAFLTCPMS
jgi:hypothetical protein